jgi:hypothetical protein
MSGGTDTPETAGIPGTTGSPETAARLTVRSWPSLLLGLGLPTVALLGGIIALSGSSAHPWGIPALYLWVFCCFPFFTVCMWAAWRFFDRDAYRDESYPAAAEPPATSSTPSEEASA